MLMGGATRIVGADQGFLGLPIRDVVAEAGILAGQNIMLTAWKPSQDEIAQLIAGDHVVLMMYGLSHPPVRVEVGMIDGTTELDGVTCGSDAVGVGGV